MELTVLGSGCFAPPKPGKGELRNPSGYAARLGGRTLLFDFGFGNFRQMVRAGIEPSSVTHAFFTHDHLDHIGDLSALLFHFRYDDKPQGGVLRVVGPQGFSKRVRAVQRAHAPFNTPRGYKLIVKDLPPGRTFKGPNFQVKTIKVPHFVHCQALRLEAGGRAFTYSGDTAYHEPLARFAAGSDLFVLECSQPASRPLPAGHMTAKDAIRLARLAGCRRTLLSHISEGAARDARRLLDGKRNGIRIARDLQTVKL